MNDQIWKNLTLVQCIEHVQIGGLWVRCDPESFEPASADFGLVQFLSAGALVVAALADVQAVATQLPVKSFYS